MSIWPDKSVLAKDATASEDRALPALLSLSEGWVQDVTVDNPQNGETLIYDTLAGKWTNTPSDSKSLRLYVDSLVFASDVDGTVTPDYITLEAKKANVSGVVDWVTVPSVTLYDAATGGAATTTGNAVYLRKADMGALRTLAVTASIASESVSDKATIAAVKDGSALTPIVTNMAHGLPTTSTGDVTYTGSGTEIRVYEGTTELIIVAASAVGLYATAGAITNTGTTEISVGDHSTITANNARITYTLTVTRINGSNATVRVVQSLFKAWQGAAGSSAAGFSVSSSGLVFRRNTANAITYPDSLKFVSKLVNVSGSVVWSTTPAVTLYSAATGGTVTTTGGTVYLRKSDMGTNEQVEVTATLDGLLTDSLTVVTVRAGSDAITVVMNNPVHSFPTNYAGTITYTSSGTTIQVYEGGVIRSIHAIAATGTGVTPGGVVSSIPATTVGIGAHSALTTNTASVAYAVTFVKADGTYGYITCHQSLTKSPQGETGSAGTRGSVIRYLTGSAWLDATATASVPLGLPIEGDTVTISNGTNFVLTKVYTSGAWAAPGTVIDGNLLVTNSITASKINTSGLNIKDTGGNVRASIDSNGQFQIFDYAGVRKIGLLANGNVELFGDIYVKGQNMLSGDDTKFMAINGGSSVGTSTGAYVAAYGNTSSFTGMASVVSGNLGSTGTTYINCYPHGHATSPNAIRLITTGGTGPITLGGSVTANDFAVTASKTAKFVLAAPNASAGAPTWRLLSASDVGAMATSHAANSITGFGASATALGTSSAGSAATVSRSDHVHATPTSFPAAISVTGTITSSSYFSSTGGTGCFLYVTTTPSVCGTATEFRPSGIKNLGNASFRWAQLFASTAAIDVSDARMKTAVAPFTATEIAAAKDLAREIGGYRFLASVAEKGDSARVHIGMTVQRAVEIMQSHGLDPLAYSFICYDKWPARDATFSDDGTLQEEGCEAGDGYGFRVTGLLLFIARGLEARLTALEERL